ncbi:MOSC domain-containing protein [Bremerella sp. JC817]|uniref:MOSC domain-containing protein n=1 Tax=Bremerella sp. JC817 TaxID=3231756 RepID=UPI003459C9B6
MSETELIAAEVVQLAVGMPKRYGDPESSDPMHRVWTTGFFKQPVEGEVQLNQLGFEGDGVADLVNHGGVDKAVLCYCAEHYPVWRNEFQQIDSLASSFPVKEFGNGAFGENLTVSGLNEETVCLGDVYEIGTAEVQVSQPRQPCWKLGRRWQLKQLTALAVTTGRMGWYIRVLEEGAVAKGQAMQLIERPLPDWPITRVNELFYRDRHNVEDARTMADCPLLAEVWREDFRSRVKKSEG